MEQKKGVAEGRRMVVDAAGSLEAFAAAAAILSGGAAGSGDSGVRKARPLDQEVELLSHHFL